MSTAAPQSFSFQATEPVIRAFEKYAYDKEFCALIDYLNSRAVALAIMAIGQKDDILNRWLGGRSQELLDIVAMFSERKKLRMTEEFLGEIPEDPLRGVDM